MSSYPLRFARRLLLSAGVLAAGCTAPNEEISSGRVPDGQVAAGGAATDAGPGGAPVGGEGGEGGGAGGGGQGPGGTPTGGRGGEATGGTGASGGAATGGSGGEVAGGAGGGPTGGALEPDLGVVGCVPGTPGPDQDDDGITDPCDNCPDAANHNQADVDGDGLGDVCDVPPDCLPGDTENRPCGLNGTGTESRACDSGAWLPFGACLGADECLRGTTETRACQGGEQSRACPEGAWSPWSPCAAPPVCANGETESMGCGLNGRGQRIRTCINDAWGAFGPCEDSDVCPDQTTESQACGANGMGLRERTCVQGAWSAFGACVGAGECVNGASESRLCGPNNRGMQSRLCADGRWGAFGACGGDGVCVDNTVETRACGEDDDGLQERTCVRGQWGAWGICEENGLCEDGQQRDQPCGLNGRGVQAELCFVGQWTLAGACADPDACVDFDAMTNPCVGGGEQTSECIEGQWGPYSICPHVIDGCETPEAPMLLGLAGAQGNYNTEGYGEYQTASCGRGAVGAEVAVPVQVVEAGVYHFETFSDRDTVLHLRRDCADPGGELICDDEGGDNTNSAFDVSLEPGQYFLIVDSYYAEQAGPVTVSVRQSDLACVDGSTGLEACEGGQAERLCIDSAWTEYGPCVAHRCDSANDAICRACTDALEINDSLGNAAGIQPGLRYNALNLCPNRDVHDYYGFEVDTPSMAVATATVAAGSPAQGPYDVNIQGYFERFPQFGVSSPGSYGHAVFVSTPGNYFAHLSGPSLPNRLDYAFRVDLTPSTACDHIGQVQGCVPCVDRLDPNDSEETARPVNLNLLVGSVGVCADNDPSDFYTFVVANRRQITVEFTRYNHIGYLSMLWTDAAGRLVANRIDGDAITSSQTATVDPGTYYLEARAQPGIGAYTFIVRGQ